MDKSFQVYRWLFLGAGVGVGGRVARLVAFVVDLFLDFGKLV